MNLTRKEPKDMEKDLENGLTPKQKKFLDETMHRHDKALKKLAQM